MTPTQARNLAAALVRAADLADLEGRESIDLGAQLQAQDDTAREELAQAITEASRTGG